MAYLSTHRKRGIIRHCQKTVNVWQVTALRTGCTCATTKYAESRRMYVTVRMLEIGSLEKAGSPPTYQGKTGAVLLRISTRCWFGWSDGFQDEILLFHLAVHAKAHLKDEFA